jgi:outer membrane protein assembly factor BamB
LIVPGVIPVLLGPLQALMMVLPPILVGLVLVARLLVSPLTWKMAGIRLWEAIRTRPLQTSVKLAGLAVAIAFAWWLLGPVEAPLADSGGIVGADSWPGFQGGPTRCGKSNPSSGDLVPGGRLRWKFRDALILERKPFASSPAVAESRVVIGSDNYKLYCLDLETGAFRWAFEARYPIFSSPAIWNGRVYVGEGLHEHADCKFYCLDLTSGTVVWTIQTKSHTEASPTIVDGKVYFGAGDDGVYCADAATGDVLWQFPDAHVDCCPLVVEDRVYFGSGYGSQGVFCLEARNGQPVWRKELPAPVWGAPSFCDGKLYVGVGNGNFNESDANPYGEVRCLDPKDESDIWRFTDVKDAVLTSIAVSDNRAVFGSRDGGCYALDATTGERVWRAECGAPILSSPAIVGDRVLFGADDGLLHCLNLSDGQEIWSYNTTEDMLFVLENPRIQSSPAVVGEKVLFGACNGNVYCLGGDTTATAAIAQTVFHSRLMRVADWATVGLVNIVARVTGNFGCAVILTAIMIRLFLLPLDWTQSRQLLKMRELQPVLRQLQGRCVDYRAHLGEIQTLLGHHGIRPLALLSAVALQLALFIVTLLVIQSTSAFAGKGFLWIADLSVADRFGEMPALPLFRTSLNLLPILLVGLIWAYTISLRRGAKRSGVLGHMVWMVVAVAVGVSTYRWSAAVMLFVLTLLCSGMLELWIFSLWPTKSESAPPETPQ